MSSDEVFNIRGLDKLAKAFKVKPPTARIGILGSKDARQGDETSNATVGAAHEFGTSKLERRSFLREPLKDHLDKAIESSHLGDKETLNEVIKTGDITGWVKQIAVLAEGIVLEAFNSNGYGKWKPSDMRYKKNHQTLIETQQLVRSITHEVK